MYRLPAVLALLLALLPRHAPATIFTVGPLGPNGGCSHTTLQAAVDAAALDPADDEIRVSMVAGGYTAQAVLIDNQTVTVVGGFGTCLTSTPTGFTRLSGAGGAAAPVITLRSTLGQPSVVTLERLEITDGDPGNGNGGGVKIESRGEVRILRSRIAANSAGAGGGIAVQGFPDLILRLADGVLVEGNTALFSGGGIYAFGARVEIGGAGTSVRDNHSGGNGGGISVQSVPGGAQANVVLRSGGVLGDGLVSGNSARFGGGLYIVGNSRLEAYTTDPAQPLRIAFNSASEYGGAIAIATSDDDAVARIWEALIDGNVARVGGAAFFVIGGSDVRVADANDPDFPPGGAACGPLACNRIQYNAAIATGQAGPGVVGVMRHAMGAQPGVLQLRAQVVSGNVGASLFADECFSATCLLRPSIVLEDSRIAPNRDSPQLAVMVYGGSLSAQRSTITEVGGTTPTSLPLLEVVGPLQLADSILWTPGRNVFGDFAPSTLQVRDLLTHDASAFAGAPRVQVGNPLFLDPSSDDYRLSIGSPALDAADASGAPLRDQLGQQRVVDQASVTDLAGPLDLGAYETQGFIDAIFAAGFE